MPFSGTAVGGPSFVAAKFGNGVQCATSKGGTIPNGAGIALFGTADCEFEGWFKRNGLPSGLEIPFSIGTNGVYFALGTDGKAVLGMSGVTGAGSANVCDNVQHSWAITYKFSTTTTTLYIDGVSVLSSTANSTVTGTGQIGQGYGGVATFDFNGVIDEVACSQIIQHTGNYTPQVAQYPDTRTGQLALYHLESGFTDSNVTGSTLTQNGNITVTSPNLGAVVLTMPYTGGLMTPTGIWHRDVVANFTPSGGNLLSDGGGISGSATATLTDASTLTPGTTYYYKGTLGDGTTTLTYASRSVKAAAPTIKIAVIGDSQSVDQAQCSNLSASTQEVALLQSEYGIMGVTLHNGAVVSTATADWIGTGGGSNFANLLASCGGSFVGYDVDIRIGVNDAQASVSSATYLANMTTIIANINAAGPPTRIWLHMSLPRDSGLFGEDGVTTFTDTIWPFLVAYRADLISLLGGIVKQGDFTSYDVFSENPELYFYYAPGTPQTTPGAIHPTRKGAGVMAAAMAKAMFGALYPTSVTIIQKRTPRRGR